MLFLEITRVQKNARFTEIRAIVIEHNQLFLEKWYEYFGR